MPRRPLTLRGVGALVLGVALVAAAYPLGSAWLLSFGVLLLVLLACSALWLRLPRRADAVRRVLRPEVVAVGERASVVVEVTSRSLLPHGDGSWRDDVPAGLAGTARGGFAARPPAFARSGARIALEYSVEGVRRGPWELGPLSVTEADPFGLARRARRLGGTTRIDVTPRLLPLSPLRATAGEEGRTRLSADRQGQGNDNLVPRPYAPGDSMRRVHWRASARLGDLMVREEEQESSPAARVVLDRSTSRWRPEAAAPGADPAFEAAVALCASVAWRLASEGYLVELADGEGLPLAHLGGVSDDDRSRLLRAFTTVGTRASDALPHLAASRVRPGPLVLIAGRIGVDDVALLAPLARRSGRALLFAADPAPGASEGLARAGWRVERLDAGAPEAAWERAVRPEVPHGRR